MTETILIVRVTHKKPLPTKLTLTDAAAQRIYMWLYSQGVEAGVTASLVEVPPELENQDAAG